MHCSPFILIHHACISSKITVPTITKDNITAYLGSHFTLLFYGHISVQCFSQQRQGEHTTTTVSQVYFPVFPFSWSAQITPLLIVRRILQIMFLTSGEPHTWREGPPHTHCILALQDFLGGNLRWNTTRMIPHSSDPVDAISIFISATYGPCNNQYSRGKPHILFCPELN